MGTGEAAALAAGGALCGLTVVRHALLFGQNNKGSQSCKAIHACAGETDIDSVLERSRVLAQPLQRPLVVPYVGLTVVARALSAVKGMLLGAIPSRWVREIPEIPIAAYILLLFMSVVLTRCGVPTGALC